MLEIPVPTRQFDAGPNNNPPGDNMRLFVAAVFALAVIVVSPANAANVAVRVEASLSSFSDPDGLLPFPDPGLGALLRATIRYDDSTRDNLSPTTPDLLPEFGQYLDSEASLEFEVGGLTISMLTPPAILIFNDALGTVDGDDAYTDGWTALSTTSTPTNVPGEVLREVAQFTLSSSTPTPPVSILDSDNLISPFGPEPWDTAVLVYRIEVVNDELDTRTVLASAVASVTNITVVPIPSALLLFASGLGLLSFRRRRDP